MNNNIEKLISDAIKECSEFPKLKEVKLHLKNALNEVLKLSGRKVTENTIVANLSGSNTLKVLDYIDGLIEKEKKTIEEINQPKPSPSTNIHSSIAEFLRD